MTNHRMLYSRGRCSIKTRKIVVPTIPPPTANSAQPEELTEDFIEEVVLFIENQTNKSANQAYIDCGRIFGLPRYLIKKIWIREVLSRIEEKQKQQT